MKDNFSSAKVLHLNTSNDTRIQQKNNSEAVVLDEEIINIKDNKNTKDKVNESNVEIVLKLQNFKFELIEKILIFLKVKKN